MYDDFLTAMPSLKEATLEITPTYVHNSSPIVYPLIETMSLQATAGDKIQAVLDGLSTKFSNLKSSNLFYYFGSWSEELKEYQILLPDYSLESLMFNLTPMKFKTERDNSDKHVVVQVSITSINEQRLYPVRIDMFSRRIRVNKTHLTDPDKYYRIHVIIKDLQRLDICNYLFAHPDEKYMRCGAYSQNCTLFGTERR